MIDGKQMNTLAASSMETIRSLFSELSLEDKVKVIDSLVDPLKAQIDKVIHDTYDPNFSGCSEFFIENSCIYWNSPKDYKSERYMTACSYDQENISFPLRWLDKNCNYKAEYKAICEAEDARDKACKEREEKEMLKRLVSKYGYLEQ